MENKIVFSGELMATFHFRSASAFNRFFNRVDGFPKPFKVGNRNAWHRDDIESWLKEQREASNAK